MIWWPIHTSDNDVFPHGDYKFHFFASTVKMEQHRAVKVKEIEGKNVLATRCPSKQINVEAYLPTALSDSLDESESILELHTRDETAMLVSKGLVSPLFGTNREFK